MLLERLTFNFWLKACREGSIEYLDEKILNTTYTIYDNCSTCDTCNIYALLTKREGKMAGYWPSSFFAFLWTETKSRSIKTQKKNGANIQPS